MFWSRHSQPPRPEHTSNPNRPAARESTRRSEMRGAYHTIAAPNLRASFTRSLPFPIRSLGWPGLSGSGCRFLNEFPCLAQFVRSPVVIRAYLLDPFFQLLL